MVHWLVHPAGAPVVAHNPAPAWSPDPLIEVHAVLTRPRDRVPPNLRFLLAPSFGEDWYTDFAYMVGNATIADDDCRLLTCFQCARAGCAATRQTRTPWRAPGTATLAGGPCGTIGWDGAVGRNASITHGIVT